MVKRLGNLNLKKENQNTYTYEQKQEKTKLIYWKNTRLTQNFAIFRF